MLSPRPDPGYDAVLFDLLSALVDSWRLWDEIAGDVPTGRAWRQAYLQRTYRAGAYRPYPDVVAEAAAEAGLTPQHALALLERWQELRPWPEVPAVLGLLAPAVRLGVLTNCSRTLGYRAAEATGGAFAAVVTAEETGVYKPTPDAYRAGLRALAAPPERVLYVAGSAFDVVGAAAMGMAVYWHDRFGQSAAPEHAGTAAAARWVHDSLRPLAALFGADEVPGAQ